MSPKQEKPKSVDIDIYIYIYIHTYINICIYLSIYPYLAIYLSTYLRTYLAIYISIYLWVMVKNTTQFQVLRVLCKYFTIFSLITTFSTDVTKSPQCKGTLFKFFYVMSPDVMFGANKSILTLVTTLGDDFWSFVQQVSVWVI